MPIDFKLPDVGEGITEGELVEIKVKEGQEVREHEVLCKIETDKAVVDMPSPAKGTILKVYHKVGDTVKVGETLFTIGKLGETNNTAAPKKSTSVMGEIEDADNISSLLEKKSTQADRPIIATDVSGPAKHAASQKQYIEQSSHALATPAVRRLARELNADIEKIQGTGLNGRVTEEDVRKASITEESELAQQQETISVKKFDMWGYIEHMPLKGVRKSIAKHMVESMYTAPHVTHMDECDVNTLVAHHEKEKQKLEKKGVHLTFMPFIVKACIAALQKHPYLNSSLDDEHEEIVLKKYYNIGIAVDTEDGLMAPVVKGADKKSMIDIAKEIEELAKKSRERTLDLMDMKGGTFTITNVGSIGGMYATPIINYPEAAILAVGRIYDKVVVNQQGKIVVRKYMPFSLAFDHRILDGAEAARFAATLKEYLEDPDELLIEGK